MENYMEVFEVLPQPCLLLKQEEDDILIQNVNRAFLQTTGLRKGKLLQQCLGKLLILYIPKTGNGFILNFLNYRR